MAEKKTFILGSYKNPGAKIKAYALEMSLKNTDIMISDYAMLVQDLEKIIKGKPWKTE